MEPQNVAATLASAPELVITEETTGDEVAATARHFGTFDEAVGGRACLHGNAIPMATNC